MKPAVPWQVREAANVWSWCGSGYGAAATAAVQPDRAGLPDPPTWHRRAAITRIPAPRPPATLDTAASRTIEGEEEGHLAAPRV